MVECLTCKGRYEPIQADGTRYFHTCPPLSVVELQDAIDAGDVVLSSAQRAQLDDAIAADKAKPPKKEEISNVVRALSSLSVRREDHRDENIAIPAIDKRAAVIVAEGKGEPRDVA